MSVVGCRKAQKHAMCCNQCKTVVHARQFYNRQNKKIGTTTTTTHKLTGK